MVKCAVSTCGNDDRNKTSANGGLKFCSFPKDKGLYEKWVMACGMHAKISKSSRICSEHFLEEHFNLQDTLLNIPINRRRLKPDAVPSENLPIKLKATAHQKRYDEGVRKKLVEDAMKLYEEAQDEELEDSVGNIGSNSNSSSTVTKRSNQMAYDERVRKQLVEEAIRLYEEAQNAELEESMNANLNKSSQEVVQLSENPQKSQTRPQQPNKTCSRRYEPTKMENKIPLQRICRTCATVFNEDTTVLIPAFERIKLTTKLSNDLCLSDELVYLDLKIKKDDGLPQQICLNCVKIIARIYAFRQKCNESQKKLQKFFISLGKIVGEDSMWESSPGYDVNKIEYGEEYIDKCEPKDDEEMVDYFMINNIKICEFEMQPKAENEIEILDDGSNKVEVNKADDDDADEIEMCDRCNKFVRSSRLESDKIMCMLDTKDDDDFQISTELEFCCFYCNGKFETAENIKEHILQLHPKEKPFQCAICNEYFASMKLRKRHYQNAHPFGDYECSICSRKFNNSVKFKYHMRLHNENKQYKCRYCDKTFKGSAQRQHHEEIHTNLDRPYKCEQCGRDYLHRKSYRVHLKNHDDNINCICETCGKGFNTQRALYAHRQHHTLRHQCEFCGKKFAKKERLEFHRAIHTGHTEIREKFRKYYRQYSKRKRLQDKKLLTCSICSKQFKIPSALEKHMKVHDKSRRHQCDFCENSYPKPNQLHAHINRTHSKEKFYDCSHCDKRFYDISVLRLHKANHLLDKKQCSYCDKSYSAHYIRIHERIHTQEKTIQCSICNQVFLEPWKLRMHLKNHTTEEIREIEAKILANNGSSSTKVH